MNHHKASKLFGVIAIALLISTGVTLADTIKYWGRVHEQYQGDTSKNATGGGNVKTPAIICEWLERNDYTEVNITQAYGDPHNVVTVNGSGSGDYDWEYSIFSGSITENTTLINKIKNRKETIETEMRDGVKHTVVFFLKSK